MQPLEEEILRAAIAILVALKTYTDEHGREYHKTIEALHSVEEEIDRRIASMDTERETAPQHPPRRLSLRRQVYLSWYTAIAQTRAALLQISNAFHRLGYAVGERLPTRLRKCHACGRRELDTECRFTRDQVICIACLHGVVKRANIGRGPEEPNFTSDMIEELLSLAELAEWRRRFGDDERAESERMLARVRQFRRIIRSGETVRRRWLVALAPVVIRLDVFEEVRHDERIFGEE